MGKIVYLMGKSSSGKDTIFKELMKEGTMDLRTIVPYTTRPIRAGEENGVEYFFTDEAGFQALKDQGKSLKTELMIRSMASGGILQWMTDRSIWQNRTIS